MEWGSRDEQVRRFEAHTVSTATAFVEIVEALIDDFDVIDVLTGLATRSVEREQVGLLELFETQNQQGPCPDCYTSGETVMHPALDQPSPWPEFAVESVRAGFPSVFAVRCG